MMIRHSILYILILLLGTVICSCQEELDMPEGKLLISIDDISDEVQTRSTPAELHTDDMRQYTVRVLKASGNTVYEHSLTGTEVRLPVGEYTVEAFHGDNPVMAPDAPYFYGRTEGVMVEQDKTAQAMLKCHVANALVSVRFGRDEEEKARFDQYYERYLVRVCMGELSCAIKHTDPQSSIYFRAGSQVSLIFEGWLKENGQKVSMPLNVTGTSFPTTFEAADHAIVTLALAKPMSVVQVSIDKVEMEEASVQATIPVNWLPAPSAEVKHQYDAQGKLVGTNLTFGHGYLDKDWKFDVRNASGNLVRSESGTGTLTSLYSSYTSSWPYLPEGEYTVTYYVKTDGKMQQTAQRTITVGAPTLTVSVDAYTSYSKYLAGDISTANACNAYTIYNPSASLNVADALLSNEHYGCSFTASIGNDALTATQNGNKATFANKTGMEPRMEAYQLSCNATFAGTTATATRDLYITGLPVSFTPPTKNNGWSNSGSVSWSSTQVKLGGMSTGSQNITCNKVAIPSGTKISCPYSVKLTGGTIATTMTLSVGSQQYFSQKSPTAFLSSSSQSYESTGSLTLSENATSLKAQNSYGAGNTCSYVYYLKYMYAK